jgi:hypothetical protein
MSAAAEELNRAKSLLSKETFQEKWNFSKLATFLEQLASMFPRTSQDQHRSIIAEFHSCAGRFPTVMDFDFGALVLETTADSLEKSELRTWLYTEARIRAIMCAQGASGDGEGMSKIKHVQRLEEKLQT